MPPLADVQMTTPERNLVLVHTQPFQARAHFEQVRQILRERAPDIEVFIVDNAQTQSVTRRKAAQRPSLVFSPVALDRFRPMRGKLYAARRLTKWEEYQRIVAAGLPAPQAVMLEPDTRLDPETWGPFTVLKPNVGYQGEGVRLVRTRDVRWRDPFSWPTRDPRRGVQMIAQKFIDTGPMPRSHRVLVVFGRALYSVLFSVTDAPVFDRDPSAAHPLEERIASTNGARTIAMNDEPDVIDLACRVAQGIPDIASLGIDIVRNAATGGLYVLEINTRGMTWHFSSAYGMQQQQKFGLDYAAQFGAVEVLADALIEVTRREAE